MTTLAGSTGSGLWSTQHALFKHLAQGYHGLTGEVADVRRDINTVLSPLVAAVVEEYDLPLPATAAAIMPVTASAAAAQSFTLAQLTGSIGSGVISPPRNIEVVVAGTTATQMAATVTITGLDAWGRALTETITGTSGGAATYTGVKCFAKVTGVSMPAGTGTAATFSIGTAVVIGLSNFPKMRAGQKLPLVRREIFDASVVTNGVLTLPATNPPFGAYTPTTAPSTPGAAVFTGTADVTAGALYGVSATLDGLVLEFTTINGAGPFLITFNGATNTASEAAMLAALAVAFPQLTFTVNVSNHLVITDKTSGAAYSVVLAATGTSTSNTALGLTAATQTGTGHQYAIEFESDATQQTDKTAIGMSGSSYGPIPGTVPTV
jgi:hypothetical protein